MELHDDHVVRREMVLPVDRDTAWENLGDAEGLAGWLADEVELEVRKGAEGIARWTDGAAVAASELCVICPVISARALSLRAFCSCPFARTVV